MSLTLGSEEERPGWVWLLTMKPEAPAPFDQMMDEDDVDELEGEIWGCYATRELLYKAAREAKLEKFGVMHILVEGLAPETQQLTEAKS